MKYLNTFKLFESSFSKFDIFLERIESVADDLNLHYTKNNKVKHEHIQKTLKVMDGIISCYIDDGNYSPYGDKFKINIFIPDEKYQEIEDEVNDNVEFLSEIENQEFVVYNKDYTLRNIEYENTENFRKFEIDFEDGESKHIRVISVVFKCSLESTDKTIFLFKRLYDIDKDFFNEIIKKKDTYNIIPTFFQLYMDHKGLDLSWEVLSAFKDQNTTVDVDVDDFSHPSVSTQDKYNHFPKFFEKVYEYSGIITRLVTDDDSTEYYVDKSEGYTKGYTPNKGIQEVLDKLGLELTPQDIFVDR